jgi:hypothetical protein
MHSLACQALRLGSGESIGIITIPTKCLWKEIESIHIEEVETNELYAFVIALFSFFVAWIIPKVKMAKGLSMWIATIAILTFVSSAFFAIIPAKFPYTIGNFTEFYLHAEIFIWVTIPIFLSLCLAPVPTSMVSKTLLIAFTIAYSIVLGICRYALFIYVLIHIHFLFMPVLFFIFGPLLDIYAIISLYALYVSAYSKKIKEGFSI